MTSPRSGRSSVLIATFAFAAVPGVASASTDLAQYQNAPEYHMGFLLGPDIRPYQNVVTLGSLGRVMRRSLRPTLVTVNRYCMDSFPTPWDQMLGAGNVQARHGETTVNSLGLSAPDVWHSRPAARGPV